MADELMAAFANAIAHPAARIAFLADDALVIDHDVPFPMDAGAYRDHVAFHADKWVKVERIAGEVRVIDHGETMIADCTFVERGRPVDAGFRLRTGWATAVCARTDAGWRALSLHLSPTSAQILDASPS